MSFTRQIKKLKETTKMYHQFVITLALLTYFDLENVQSASIGTIAQNIHSDLLLLDANLGSNIRSNREGRRINLNKFAVPSGMISNTIRCSTILFLAKVFIRLIVLSFVLK